MLEHLLHAFSEDKIEQSRVKHQEGETREDNDYFNDRMLQTTINHTSLRIPFVKVKTGNQFHFFRASESSLRGARADSSCL